MIPCTEERIRLTQKIAEATQELRLLSYMPRYDEPNLPGRVTKIESCLRVLKEYMFQANKIDAGESITQRVRILRILDNAIAEVRPLTANSRRADWDWAIWLCQQAANEIHQAFLS